MKKQQTTNNNKQQNALTVFSNYTYIFYIQRMTC